MKTEKREVDSEEKREHEIPGSREGYHIEIGVIEDSRQITSIRERKRKQIGHGIEWLDLRNDGTLERLARAKEKRKERNREGKRKREITKTTKTIGRSI